MPLHLYYSIFYLCIRKEICGDLFSSLIMRVRMLYAAGTPGGYVEGFGVKNIMILVKIFFFYQFSGSPSPSSNLAAVGPP
jgi:hypothetical protein